MATTNAPNDSKASSLGLDLHDLVDFSNEDPLPQEAQSAATPGSSTTNEPKASNTFSGKGDALLGDIADMIAAEGQAEAEAIEAERKAKEEAERKAKEEEEAAKRAEVEAGLAAEKARQEAVEAERLAIAERARRRELGLPEEDEKPAPPPEPAPAPPPPPQKNIALYVAICFGVLCVCATVLIAVWFLKAPPPAPPQPPTPITVVTTPTVPVPVVPDEPEDAEVEEEDAGDAGEVKDAGPKKPIRTTTGRGGGGKPTKPGGIQLNFGKGKGGITY